jgi:hypothetical protein
MQAVAITGTTALCFSRPQLHHMTIFIIKYYLLLFGPYWTLLPFAKKLAVAVNTHQLGLFQSKLVQSISQ